jgi:hypothetical protein
VTLRGAGSHVVTPKKQAKATTAAVPKKKARTNPATDAAHQRTASLHVRHAAFTRSSNIHRAAK